MKRILLVLLLLSAGFGYAQNYPKYKTKRVKDTVFEQPQRVVDKDTIKTDESEKPLSDFDELIRKGRQAQKEGDSAKAIDFFTTALTISNKDNEWCALENRGCIYVLIKEFDKAAADFTTIIDHNNTEQAAHIGFAHLMRGCIALSTTNKEDDEYRCNDFKKAREYGALSGDKGVDADCD